jgi:hypothetical protein
LHGLNEVTGQIFGVLHEKKLAGYIGRKLNSIGKFPAFAEMMVFWLVIYDVKK